MITSRKLMAIACASTSCARIVRKKLNVSAAKCPIREAPLLCKFFSWLARASQLSYRHWVMLANTRALIQQQLGDRLPLWEGTLCPHRVVLPGDARKVW